MVSACEREDGNNMLGIGANDLIDLLVIAVVVLKPRKLYPLDCALRKGVRDFRKAFAGGEEERKKIDEKQES